MPKRKNDCIDLYHFEVHPEDRGPQEFIRSNLSSISDQAESADEGGELNVTCVAGL